MAAGICCAIRIAPARAAPTALTGFSQSPEAARAYRWIGRARGETAPPEISLWSGFDLAQRAGLVGEVAGAERLHAGVVLTVEGRGRARAAGRGRVLRRVEPQAQVVHLHGIERRV